MVTILMMSAEMATLGLLKIKVFKNKGYYIINTVPDVTNKILSREKLYCRCDQVTKVWRLEHFYERS